MHFLNFVFLLQVNCLLTLFDDRKAKSVSGLNCFCSFRSISEEILDIFAANIFFVGSVNDFNDMCFEKKYRIEQVFYSNFAENSVELFSESDSKQSNIFNRIYKNGNWKWMETSIAIQKLRSKNKYFETDHLCKSLTKKKPKQYHFNIFCVSF